MTTLDVQHADDATEDHRSWEKIRSDFPALDQEVDGQPLSYLDNAASSQTPESVIERIERYQRRDHANVHRGVHELSQRATDAYEGAREKIAAFIGAPSPEQCIFTRGATEAVNLVAQAWGRDNLEAGDEILLTRMEHHSNIVPWQQIREATGAEIKVLPVTDDGELRLDLLDDYLTERTAIVSVVHVSNTLGTINPIDEITERAHARDVPVLVDGCQAVPHRSVDVEQLDADFYAFSGHKMNGPTGIGVLYGKRDHLEAMPPYQGGGEMIRSVSFEETTYAPIPNKFEAGTPAIMPAVGLGAAVDYLTDVGMDRIAEREDELLAHATERLESIDDVRIFGRAPEKASVLSFDLEDVHPHDIGTILDTEGVAVRAGHHCTQPLMERLGVPATTRASFSYYNTKNEADRLAEAIERVREIF